MGAKIKKHPTQLRLRFLFYYKNGQLYHTESGSGFKAHARFGGPNGHGYLVGGVDSYQYFLHRLIWIWHYGNTPYYIDHKNGNKKDNRIINLRLATKAHNTWHIPKRRHNSTGYKGVYLLKQGKPKRPYWAYITANGKRTSLGSFTNGIAAARAYNKAAKKIHGKFAWINEL